MRKREASLREVAEQMKASLEDATREQRRLTEEKKRMEEELETLRRAVKSPQRLLLREETGITLASLNMDATTIAKELERRGMSAVDLYARTLQAEDECTRMKLCKERVEECVWRRAVMYSQLDHVLSEIEAKAPQIAQLQEECEALRTGKKRLTALYDSQVNELADRAKEVEELRGEVTRLRDCVVPLEQIAKDAQKQLVCVMRQRIDATADPSNRDVLFSNLDELVACNQRLLRRVRLLEQQTGNSAVQEPADDVEKELAALRRERETQKALVGELVKQRDMYRVLLTQNATLPAEPAKPAKSADNAQQETETLRAKLEATAMDLERCRREADLERRSAADARKEMKAKQDVVQTMEKQLHAMEEEVSSLKSRLQNSQEEMTATSARLQSAEGERTTLQNQVEKLVAEQKALQEASSAWEQEQERARQLLKSAEQDASNTANTVQATITALEKEKAALKEEVARKQEVVDELQAVQMMRMQEVSVRVRHHA